MDYVTCGTGSLLPLRQDHADVAVSRRGSASRSPPRSRRVVRHARRPGREPHPDAGRPPRRSSPPATPTWSASSAARSPIRTWSPRPAPGAPTTCGRASRATSCAGAVARATTGSRASSTRPRGASGSGAATGSSRPPRPRPVLVVGGGPAGLEAARVAAERGHRVTLVERGPALGGQFRLAGLQPSREPDHGPDRVVRPAARAARRRGPARRRRCRATDVAAIGPPTRSSSRPGRGRPGPGSSARCRWSTGCRASDDADASPPSRTCSTARPTPGRGSLVLDDLDDWRGLGTALHLAESGHDVTIVTVRAGRRRRPVPQRRRRPAPRALRAAPAADRSPAPRSSSAGGRAPPPSESTLTGRAHEGRRGHARHRRDARRRDRPCRRR